MKVHKLHHDPGGGAAFSAFLLVVKAATTLVAVATVIRPVAATAATGLVDYRGWSPSRSTLDRSKGRINFATFARNRRTSDGVAHIRAVDLDRALGHYRSGRPSGNWAYRQSAGRDVRPRGAARAVHSAVLRLRALVIGHAESPGLVEVPA